MKVNKASQSKGHTKSHKWKDVRGKRSRPPIDSSELHSTPVITRMVKEHHVAVKKKPSVKRLKNKPKAVTDSKKTSPQSGQKKSTAYSQANGSSAFTMDNESDDSQEWKEFFQSVQGNGVDVDTEDAQPGRLEGAALHFCAERDDRKNHAVLVLQKKQVGAAEEEEQCSCVSCV